MAEAHTLKESPAQGGLNREIFTAAKHQNGLIKTDEMIRIPGRLLHTERMSLSGIFLQLRV